MKLAFARTAFFSWTKDTPRAGQARLLSETLGDPTPQHSLIDAVINIIAERTLIDSASAMLRSSNHTVQVVLSQESCTNAIDTKYGIEITYFESSSRDGTGPLVAKEKHEYTFWLNSHRFSYDHSYRANEWQEMRCACAERRYNQTELLHEDVLIIKHGLECIGIVLPI